MRSRRFIISALCALLLPTSVFAAVAWQVIKIGGRDFLTIDNVARFYGVAEPAVQGTVIRLTSSKNEVLFRLGSREMMINGVRNWLSFPVSTHEGKLVLSRIDLAKTLEPQLRPNMIQNLGHVQTIDKGAGSNYGYEKDYALDVARKLRPLLQAKGFKVIMTRESDVFVPLALRAQIGNATHDSVFVSIHFNATDRDPAATGFEIYSLTPRGAPSTYEDDLTLASVNIQNGTGEDTASVELSSCIYHSLVGQVGEFDRGIKRARFAVLRLTKIPAVLVEGGFLTERGESRLIANPEWRGKLALAISAGIDNFRILADTKKRPLLMADYRRGKNMPPPAEKPAFNDPAAPASLSLDMLHPLAPAPQTSPSPSASPSLIGSSPIEP